MQEIRLSNPQMVRRLLNRTINQLLKDDISTDKARCIGYLSGVLLKSMEVEELDKRISEIEAQMLKETG